MIKSIKYYVSGETNPYYNLAVEQHLLETVPEGCCILYLWQNRNTVVIGKNQNPWKECRTSQLKQDGGTLARRLSGGGAVFHDLGNLNFTFLVPTEDYDLDKQLQVIAEACRSLGIEIERSGRNDLLADGRKFSGNAYYEMGKKSYHHGTLLVDVDMDKLSRYLKPSKAKLMSKGVDSVKSRVINLRELKRELTIGDLRKAMIASFQRVYGMDARELAKADLNQSRIAELQAINSSWDWIFGRKIPFTFQCEDKFIWGEIQIQLQVKEGVIESAQVFSDAMDWSISGEIKKQLEHTRFHMNSLEDAVLKTQCSSQVQQDIIKMLRKQEI